MGKKAEETKAASAAEIAENDAEQREFADVEIVGEAPPDPFLMDGKDLDPDTDYYLATGVTRGGFDSVVSRRKRQGYVPVVRGADVRMRGISAESDLSMLMQVPKRLHELHFEGRQAKEAENIAAVQDLQTGDPVGLDGQSMRRVTVSQSGGPDRKPRRKRQARGRSMVSVSEQIA